MKQSVNKQTDKSICGVRTYSKCGQWVLLWLFFPLASVTQHLFPSGKRQAPQRRLERTTAPPHQPRHLQREEGWARGSGPTTQSMALPLPEGRLGLGRVAQSRQEATSTVLPTGDAAAALGHCGRPEQGVRRALSAINLHRGKPEGKAISAEASAEGLSGFLWIY